MRINQFERDALINIGKKQGYITEGMSQEQINELMPSDVVKGAKKVGKAVKTGAGAVAGAVKKGVGAVGQAVDQAGGVTGIAKQAGAAVGQGVNKVKDVAKAAGQGFAQTQGQGQAVDPKATDQKATQKVAQRATALKSVAGGNASGGMVAKGMDKVASGSTLPPNLIKAIQPYTQSIQKMMQDPQLFSKFKMLMKQANAVK